MTDEFTDHGVAVLPPPPIRNSPPPPNFPPRLIQECRLSSNSISLFHYYFSINQEMPEDKRMKVKKGWVAVCVGLEEEDGGFRKFMIPISHLHHPLFVSLLDKAQEVYGYQSPGPLRLPCSVRDFLRVRCLIERPQHFQQHYSSFLSLPRC